MLRLYKNFFQPTMKLIEKVRDGGKIHRKYDEPRTPYQRLMESGQLKPSAKQRLQAQYESLNVAELHRRTEEIRNRLFDLIAKRQPSEPPKQKRRGPGISLGWRRRSEPDA